MATPNETFTENFTDEIINEQNGAFDESELEESVSLPEKKEEPELTFEEKVARGIDFLKSNPMARETLRWALTRCANETVELHQFEDEVYALPCYIKGKPDPYFIAQWLVDIDCMESSPIDANEEVVDIDALTEAGKTDDEIDDLIESYVYKTTEVGVEVAKEFDPIKRLLALLDMRPEGAYVIKETLRFLLDPHPLAEIGHFINNTLPGEEIAKCGKLASATVLVNKLSNAGVIEFTNHAWCITPEGRGYLQQENN